MKILTTITLALGLFIAGAQEAEAHPPSSHHTTTSIAVTSFHWVWTTGYWSAGHYHSGFWKQVRTPVYRHRTAWRPMSIGHGHRHNARPTRPHRHR
jgi:hypothetical protein